MTYKRIQGGNLSDEKQLFNFFGCMVQWIGRYSVTVEIRVRFSLQPFIYSSVVQLVERLTVNQDALLESAVRARPEELQQVQTQRLYRKTACILYSQRVLEKVLVLVADEHCDLPIYINYSSVAQLVERQDVSLRLSWVRVPAEGA